MLATAASGAWAAKPVGAEEWAVPPPDRGWRPPAISAPPADERSLVETRPVRAAEIETAMPASAAEPPVATLGNAPGAALVAPAAAVAAGGEAPSGEAERWTELGRFFELSEPPSQDLARARELYCRAAAAGHAGALQRLGWLYLNGRGVARHDGIAGTMFRWAADLGDTRASALAATHPASSEYAPPCLSSAGIATFASLKAKLDAARAAARAADTDGATLSIASPVATSAALATIAATAGMSPSLDALPPERRRIVEAVEREARAALLDPRLVLAVIRAESNFDPLARSPRNALGLMQLIPETAQRFRVRDPLDPLENVRGGIAYLRWLLAYYRGDVKLALAAYNAGEGTVDRHKGVPPYAETVGYIQRIRAFYPHERHPFDVEVLGATPFRIGSPAVR